jgi:hypothetical protein
MLRSITAGGDGKRDHDTKQDGMRSKRIPPLMVIATIGAYVFLPYLEFVRIWRRARYARLRAAACPWTDDDDALFVESRAGTRRIPIHSIARADPWLEEDLDFLEVESSIVVVRTRDGSRYVLDGCDPRSLEERGIAMGTTRNVEAGGALRPFLSLGWLVLIGVPSWLVWSGLVAWPWMGAWLVLLGAAFWLFVD